MTVKLYTLPSNTSSRKVRKYLDDNGIEYVMQNMKNDPLSWKQLIEILSNCENGVADIISDRSKFYLEYIEQGGDFDEVSLIDFYYLAKDNPTLISAPIMVTRGDTMVGYKPEYMRQLDGREKRMREYLTVLKEVRDYEEIERKYMADDIEELEIV